MAGLSHFQKLRRWNLCKKHTYYSGKVEPITSCLECWEVWRALERPRESEKESHDD